MGFSIDVDPLAERQAGNLKTPLQVILIAAVGALMLIACANISNLLLARAMLRRKEMSIRAALGAGRWRVIRQLLTESMVLAISGGALGVIFALYSLRLYTQFGPQNLIKGTQPAINLWVMGFSMLISIGASLLFGLAPAIDTSRINLAEALKEGARGSSGGRRLLRESMVAAEVAVSLILLIGAGLLIRSFAKLSGTNPGFRTENVTTAQVHRCRRRQYREESRAACRRSCDRGWNACARLPGVLLGCLHRLRAVQQRRGKFDHDRGASGRSERAESGGLSEPRLAGIFSDDGYSIAARPRFHARR